MEDLLKDLAGRGFNDERLRADIEINEAYGLPRFSISRVKEFGEERMYYKLTFQWLDSSMGYEFTAIYANHRMPVDIDQCIVNGINSIWLDQEMSKINWPMYWESKRKEEPANEALEMAYQCIDGLAQLLLSESLQAKFTGESLMYKHWPSEIFRLFSEQPDRMGRLYEHDYNFDLKEHADITAGLAYLIISERINALKMHITNMGITQVPDSVIEKEVHSLLKELPDKADLKFSFSSQEYYATLKVPVFLDKGWYNLEGYTLKLVQLPEIKHGIFNGVDSEKLDKKMSTVNWREDKDIAFVEKNAEVWFPRDIELLQEEIFRIGFYPEGKEVADLLMLKHWLCAPVFNDFISQQAKDRLIELPTRAASFSSDIHLDNALGLLYGRPVWKKLAEDQEHGLWQRLAAAADGRQAKLVTFEAISKKQLGEICNMIPVPDNKKETILRQLLHGKEVQTRANNGKMIRLELTESVDGIRIFDQKKNEIPFNFQLNADWKPAQSPLEVHQENISKQENTQQKIALQIKAARSKGKGL